MQNKVLNYGMAGLAILIMAGLIYFYFIKNKLPAVPADQSTPTLSGENDKSRPVNNSGDKNIDEQTRVWVEPIDRIDERISKKKFGQYVDPQNSPVQPEKFRGFHTGVDLEVFPDEIMMPVTVKAVCSGRILVKEKVTGYGGVVVTSCRENNELVTVLYGHLKLDSINFKEWDQVTAGQEIGQLGAEFSDDTDGERKHLHLSVHRGEEINYLGYVQDEGELSAWIDPVIIINK